MKINNIIRWGFVLGVVIHGILIKEGIFVPRRGTDGGTLWIGLFLMAILPYLHTLEDKNEKEEQEKKKLDTLIKKERNIQDYICTTFLLLGMGYLLLYLFEVFTNIWVFIFVVLTFGMCEKYISKFFRVLRNKIN